MSRPPTSARYLAEVAAERARDEDGNKALEALMDLLNLSPVERRAAEKERRERQEAEAKERRRLASYRTFPPDTVMTAWKWFVGPLLPGASRRISALADSLDSLVDMGVIPVPQRFKEVPGAFRRRHEGEPLARARKRLEREYVASVGPVPAFYTHGRRTPTPLSIANDLATLAVIGAIPREGASPPVIALLESDEGRTIYHLMNVYGAVDPEHRPAYEAIVKAIAPVRGTQYQVFYRPARDTTYAGPPSRKEGIRKIPVMDPVTLEIVDEEYIRDGHYWSDHERWLGEDRVSDWWQQLGKYENGKMIRETRIEGNALTPGRLEAISLKMARGAPPYVTGWIIEINPLAPKDENERWLRMNDGERNCVAEAVRRSYGAALTPRIATIVDKFERGLDGGAAEEDVDDLSKALKARIRILDLAGAEVYRERVDPATGKPYYSASRKVITMYRHDGHVSLHDPGTPRITRVEVFEGLTPGVPDETPEAAINRHTANAIAFIRERRPEQAQIVGGEIIDALGCVYRPRSIDRGLHRAAADLGYRPRYCVDAFGPDADRYKEDPTTGKDLADILHIGGAQSLRFKAWRESNGWLSLWKPSREAWRSSQLESCVYRRDAIPASDCIHIDMKAAYLACDATRGSGPSRQWAERFGFPRGGRMLAASASMDELGQFAGFVEYTSGVELNATAPPGVRSQLANHFRKTADGQPPRLPIPLAVWLHERGYTTNCGRVVVHYGDRQPGITFPEDRDIAVRFIGSCAYRCSRRTMYTRDPAEAAHYARAYGSHSQPLDEGGYLISWESPDDGTRGDFSHVRAYVLAYLAIAMGEAEAALGERAVLERDTDAFVLSPDCDPARALGEQYESKYAPAWGVFRPKVMKAGAVARIATPAPGTVTVAAVGMPEGLPSLDPESSHWLIAEIGPGGCGKTHKWLHRPPNPDDETMILTFANEPAADLRTKEKNPHGYPVETFHQWFRLGQNEPKTWTPAAMGTQAFRVKRIIFDEFPVAGPEFLAMALPWLRSKGVRVILTGDPLGQLQEFNDHQSGQKVVALLRSLGADMRESYGTDWRAKDCPRLQDAKRRAWCADMRTQYRELHKVATVMSYREVLAAWKPSDIILEPTRRAGADIAHTLASVRAARYPAEPIRLKFNPADRSKFTKKKGVLPFVARPDGGEPIEAALGARIEVPAGTNIDPALWSIDDTSTIHSIQGRTIAAPRRIFICTDRMSDDWCTNALYVAMSRAQRADQLVVFSLPLPRW